MQKSSFILMVLFSFILALGFAPFAIAQQGRGGSGGMHGGGGMMGGQGHGMMGNQGYGYQTDLTQEQRNQLQQEQSRFYNETQDLRQQLYQKRQQFYNALQQENANLDRAHDLQQEISDLQARLSKEQLNHMINLRQIDSSLVRNRMGMMGGPGMQDGMMGGPGMQGGTNDQQANPRQ